MAVCGEGTRFEVVRLSGEGDALRGEWLALRRTGVGGSDVAAVLGLSPYKGAYALWAEKVGVAEPDDLSGSQAVEWGNRLEPVVAAKYKEAHPDREVRRVNGVCRSVARPWALASLDYEVRDPEAGWGVLGIKTVGLRRAGDWDDGVPLYYQTQVQHYLDVTGRPFADVAVLVGGQEWREYRIAADADDQAAVREAVDRFWGMVERREPPDPSGCDSRALLQAHPEAGEWDEVADAADVPELAAWEAARAAADAAKRALDDRAAALKARIGDARGVRAPGVRVTWKRGVRRTFDRKRFDADNPGVYDAYCREATADFGLALTREK